MNGTPIGPERSIAISESIETVELAVVLPAGFAASDGFIQRATVSAPDYFREYELPTLDGSTRIAVPPVLELVLTLSLGFCTIDTKDICYLDWTELSVSRDPALDRTRNVELRYLPEDPS